MCLRIVLGKLSKDFTESEILGVVILIPALGEIVTADGLLLTEARFLMSTAMMGTSSYLILICSKASCISQSIITMTAGLTITMNRPMMMETGNNSVLEY